MAQSVKRPTLGIGSDHDLVGSGPELGSRSVGSLLEILSLYAPPALRAHSILPSQINKSF